MNTLLSLLILTAIQSSTSETCKIKRMDKEEAFFICDSGASFSLPITMLREMTPEIPKLGDFITLEIDEGI